MQTRTTAESAFVFWNSMLALFVGAAMAMRERNAALRAMRARDIELFGRVAISQLELVRVGVHEHPDGWGDIARDLAAVARAMEDVSQRLFDGSTQPARREIKRINQQQEKLNAIWRRASRRFRRLGGEALISPSELYAIAQQVEVA